MFNKQNLFSKPVSATPERRPAYPNSISGRSGPITAGATPSSASGLSSPEIKPETETYEAIGKGEDIQPPGVPG